MAVSATKSKLHQEIDQLKEQVRQLETQLRIATEDEAARERTQLLVAVEGSIDGLAIIDLHGQILCANKSFLSIADIDDLERIKGLHFLDVFHSDILKEASEEFLADPSPQDRYEVSLEVRLKSGNLRHIELLFTYSPPAGIVCVCRNVTEKHQAEVALRESEERFRALADASFDWILIHRNGKILQVNRQVEELTIDFTSKRLLDFVPPEYHQQIIDATLSREATIHEAEVMLAEDQRIPVEILSQAVRFNGKSARLAAIRDISARKKAEAHLRYHASILDSLSDAVLTTDLEFKIVSWNKAAQAIYGWQAEEVIGKKMSEIFATEFLDSDRKGSYQALMESGVWLGQVMQKDRNDQQKIILSSVSLIFDSQGQATGVVAVNRDVTESSRTKEALQILESRNQAILNALPDMVFVLDLDLNIVDFSAHDHSKLLLEPDQIIGKNVLSMFGPEHKKKLMAAAKSVVKNGKLEVFEYSLSIDSSQQPGHFEARLVPLEAGRILAVVRDQTEKKQAEDARRVHEANYRSLFEDSRDGVFVCNADGTIISLNPAGCDILGLNVEGPSTHKHSLKSHFREAAVYDQMIDILSIQGHVHEFEATLETIGESELTVRFTATSEKKPDGGLGVIRGILRDTTVQQRLETQLFQAQKMEAIGTLAGGIAHDFNNILAAILGYTELLLQEADGESTLRRSLQEINRAGLRAKELVQQILTFSRQNEHQKRRLQLHLLINENLRFLRATLPATIEIVSNIRDKNCTILGDPVQIHRVVMNLITNSYHAIGDNPGTLTVSLERMVANAGQFDAMSVQEGDEFALITIRDTGSGIDPITQKRIFDPFFTTKPAGKGTGMGLAVVHGIVEAHKGFIELDSTPGNGCEFRVYFPLSQQEAQPEATRNEIIPTGTGHILVVDDEPTLINLCRQMLEKLGYQVSTALNSKEGLADFMSRPKDFDLVITDQVMPEMTGVQLSREIHQCRPELPIVLISGYSEALDIQDLRNCGIIASFNKPLLFAEFAKLVKQVILKAEKNDAVDQVTGGDKSGN